MTRDEVVGKLLAIFSQRFEIDQPGMEDNLNEVYEFDSIDAIELLHEIEVLLGVQLTRDEKKLAMDIRTLNEIVDYVMQMAAVRAA